MHSSVTPPTIGFFGTPTLSGLGSSFITSSFLGKHTPEMISSLIKPLLLTKVNDQEQQKRQSSHSLLLPPPIPSFRKPKDDTKPISRNCSYGLAVINGINSLCGVGILSTSYTVKVGGWAGLSIMFIFAGLSYYTGILLKRCLDSKSGLKTYPDIGQAAFGNKGRFLVFIILYLELYVSTTYHHPLSLAQFCYPLFFTFMYILMYVLKQLNFYSMYGCCVEHIILESDNLSSLFPNAHLSIGGMHINSHVLFAVITTLIVLPTTWLRDLSLLSYISAGGVIASLLIVASLFWVGLVDQVEFQNKGDSLNLTGIPIAIGLYGYCYSCHAVYPNIYSSLEKKNQFPLVLFTCFVICTVMFAGVAIIGYLRRGHPVSIHSQHGSRSGGFQACCMDYGLVMAFIGSLLTLFVVICHRFLIFFSSLKLHREKIKEDDMFTQLLILLQSMILPCACFMSIAKCKLTWIEGVFCVFVIIVGVIFVGFGTSSAISKIIESY
ncbi:putative amino acid transporter, transmembrane domain-containing protein [Dioscorea sansibarensis]